MVVESLEYVYLAMERYLKDCLTWPFGDPSLPIIFSAELLVNLALKEERFY